MQPSVPFCFQHKEQITVTSENGVTAFSFTVQMAHPMRNEP